MQTRARPHPEMAAADFAKAPWLVIWEATQACDLACVHCRAEARPWRSEQELSTAEAKALLGSVREMGRPLFVITGGDPLKRPDMAQIVAQGAALGLRMALTPSGTPLATREAIQQLTDAGLSRLAVSLDGAGAATHDAFRGVAGSWAQSVRMLRDAREMGLSTQVNTTVTRHNIGELGDVAALLAELRVSLWSVFFLVPTGRGRARDVASPEAFEYVFHRLYELSRTAPFDIKTTAAPQYRRVILQRQVDERRAGTRTEAPQPLTAGLGFSLADGVGRAKGVNDGNGCVFVGHTGEIQPSGFLPVSAGNVRTDDLAEVYREHPLFTALRDPDRLKGKCGVCEYRDVCGGSRARAFAMTGDPLEAEPFCVHEPARWTRLVDAGEAEETDDYFAARVPGWRQPVRELPDRMVSLREHLCARPAPTFQTHTR